MNAQTKHTEGGDAMNKSEIQSRIEKVESELATLKADLARCDCEDKAQAGGIEQEKCWHAVFPDGDCSMKPRTMEDCESYWKDSLTKGYPAYMPECRQVTAEDAFSASSAYVFTETAEEAARELHKLGFRMKVTK